MSLKHWILGQLCRRPRTGYSLHKWFFEPVQPALSQIYRKLGAMTEEGLVDFKVIEQYISPDRKSYSITKAGIAELDRWLREPIEPKLARDQFMIQLWLSSRLSKEQIAANMTAYMEKVENMVVWFRNDAKKTINETTESSGDLMERFCWNLATDFILAQLEAMVNSCQEGVKLVLALSPVDDEVVEKTPKNNTATSSIQ